MPRKGKQIKSEKAIVVVKLESEAAAVVAAASGASSRRSGRKRAIVDYNDDKLHLIEAAPQEKKAKLSRSVSSYNPEVYDERQPLPTRDNHGRLCFPDHPLFRPHLSPEEILRLGSFGGTYFRPIYSSVTKKQYASDEWKEFPSDWFEDLDIKLQVTSSVYREEVNRYGVKCGGDLDMWESKGWIVPIDPYGWFQWYCRFYLGRRSEDDDRQVAHDPADLSMYQLMNRIVRANTTYDDVRVSPVIRQTLQHWGYQLTKDDYIAYCKKKGFTYKI